MSASWTSSGVATCQHLKRTNLQLQGLMEDINQNIIIITTIPSSTSQAGAAMIWDMGASKSKIKRKIYWLAKPITMEQAITISRTSWIILSSTLGKRMYMLHRNLVRTWWLVSTNNRIRWWWEVDRAKISLSKLQWWQARLDWASRSLSHQVRLFRKGSRTISRISLISENMSHLRSEYVSPKSRALRLASIMFTKSAGEIIWENLKYSGDLATLMSSEKSSIPDSLVSMCLPFQLRKQW